jgi:hypothetical protein
VSTWVATGSVQLFRGGKTFSHGLDPLRTSVACFRCDATTHPLFDDDVLLLSRIAFGRHEDPVQKMDVILHEYGPEVHIIGIFRHPVAKYQ